jgi:predicted Zn finger-like uncharacterized protein
MFTVCFKCNLRLTVTATDLRAAQGYVRCGRCHNVFNALAALADDPARQAEAEITAGSMPSRPVLTPPAPPAPEPAAAPVTEDLGSTDTSLEFNPASTNINEVFIEAAPGERSTGTFESIILVGDDAPGAAEPDDGPLLAPPPQSEPVFEPVGQLPVPPAPPAAEEIPFTSTWSSAPVSPAAAGFAVSATTVRDMAGAIRAPEPVATVVEPEDTTPEMILLDAGRAAARVPRWAQQGAVALLILCLIVQVLHHYRSPLAQTAMLHRPLTTVYQALGQPLDPRWDVSRYEVRQLGASTDGTAAANLTVRASISNRALRDQPLPLLRVVMQDRFGNRVAARDLKPAEYLGRGAPQVTLMAPGQRVDVQVVFRDPGQAATGFEIDACMAGHARTVTCANDPAAH